MNRSKKRAGPFSPTFFEKWDIQFSIIFFDFYSLGVIMTYYVFTRNKNDEKENWQGVCKARFIRVRACELQSPFCTGKAF